MRPGSPYLAQAAGGARRCEAGVYAVLLQWAPACNSATGQLSACSQRSSTSSRRSLQRVGSLELPVFPGCAPARAPARAGRSGFMRSPAGRGSASAEQAALAGAQAGARAAAGAGQLRARVPRHLRRQDHCGQGAAPRPSSATAPLAALRLAALCALSALGFLTVLIRGLTHRARAGRGEHGHAAHAGRAAAGGRDHGRPCAPVHRAHHRALGGAPALARPRPLPAPVGPRLAPLRARARLAAAAWPERAQPGRQGCAWAARLAGAPCHVSAGYGAGQLPRGQLAGGRDACLVPGLCTSQQPHNS